MQHLSNIAYLMKNKLFQVIVINSAPEENTKLNFGFNCYYMGT